MLKKTGRTIVLVADIIARLIGIAETEMDDRN